MWLRLEVNKMKGFLNMKVELNHKLINDYVKTTTKVDCQQVKERIIDLSFLIDKLHIEDSERLD